MATTFKSRTGNAPEEGIKSPVIAATTANITLSGEQTIDTVAIVAGNRVLVKDQADTTENGIYDASTGSWSRSKDFNNANDVVNAILVVDSNSSVIYQASFSGDYSPGTTSMAFVNQPYASHISNPTDAHDASAISNAPAGTVAATTVQAAIDELDTEKTAVADLASTANGKGASLVAIEDSSGIFDATTVENALTEVKGNYAPYANKAEAVTKTLINGAVRFIGGTDGGWFKEVTGAAPGTYSDNAPGSPGYCGTVFIPTGGDGSEAFLRDYNGSIDPRMFGAFVDGSTSDSTAINLALDTGLSVHFQGGTFVSDTDLNMVANSQVSFSNDAIINVTGGTFALIPASNCKLINPRLHETRSYASLPNTSYGLNFSGEINVEIIGGSIDGFTYAGIGFGGCTWVDISHCTIFNVGDKPLNLGRGIRIFQPISTKVKINECHIYGNGHHGIQAFDSGGNNIVVDEIIISNNFLYDNGDNGVDLLIVSNFTITGNVCLDNGDNGLNTGGQGIHVGSTATSPQTFSGTITGNICSGCVLGFGIELIEALDVTISNNICSDNDFAGIVVRKDSKNITVLGNTCKQNQDGIRVDGTTGVCSRVTVSGNTCNENGQRGINITTSEYCTVADNITMDNATSGGGLAEGVIVALGNNNIISGGISSDTTGSPKQSHGARLHVETDSFIEDVRGTGNTSSTVSITGASSGCDIDMAKKTITPSALAAGNNNDYAANDNTVFRMSGDSGGTTVLTGIAMSFQNITNTRVRLINVSAFDIVLSHQDVASVDKGRFISPSAANITLAANDIADLEYDLTNLRWRIINVLQ